MRRYITLAVLLVLLQGQAVVSQNRPARRPRLVLIIVADQFRFDYLTRFESFFGQRGFRRLMRDGASWNNANFNYVPTKTAPGHTAIMTGAPPGVTGILANEWIERSTALKVTSVGDRNARILGGGPGERANSPWRLLASTVGDELRAAFGDGAKVIGISDKPRAAILPAGKKANAAYWLSSETGNVVSSNYYFKQLPAWVNELNRKRPLDKYFGARWERLRPESDYLMHAGPDSPPWENIDEAPGFTNAFPHIITGGLAQPGTDFYEALDHSPFVNDVLVALSEQAITNERLGQDNVTDLLTVSLSGTDHVGHRFGPHSQEIMDTVLRLDGQIARLLDFVDARVGLENVLLAFSSDHGVAPLWDYSAARGYGRTRIGHGEVMSAIGAAIRTRYGATANYIFQFNDDGVIKDSIVNGNVYFDLGALKRDGVSLDEITKLAGEAVLKLPGIAKYYTRSQLEECLTSQHASVRVPLAQAPQLFRSSMDAAGSLIATPNNPRPAPCLTDRIGSSVLRGFDPERSGDLIIIQKEFYYIGESSDPASHSTPYSYDTHVPVILMGRGIRRGKYREAATPADIAPTLSFLLGIKPPNKSQARVLSEALRRAR